MIEKVPAAPFSSFFFFFQIYPPRFKGERMKNKTTHSLPSSHSPSPPGRAHTKSVQQKHQTEIELLFQSELAVIFRKSDMLYIELQHHKVTPFPPFFSPQTSSVWLTPKYVVTLPQTIHPMFWSQIWYSAHWPDSIKGGDAYYPRKSASSWNRWSDITVPQVKLSRLIAMLGSDWLVLCLPTRSVSLPPLLTARHNICLQHVNEVQCERVTG